MLSYKALKSAKP